MNTNLFIAGLSHGVTNSQLEEHFKKVGKVVSANVITDRQTGFSRGFGFVEMSTVEEAKKAIKELSRTEIDGQTIDVKEAKSRE